MNKPFPYPLTTYGEITLSKNQTLQYAQIIDRDFAGIRLSGLSFDSCLLRNVNFASSQLRNLTLIDCVAEDCLLFGADFDQVGLLRVNFMKGSFTGLVLSGASIKTVRFTNCNLNLTNFRYAKLSSVIFEGCNLTEVDFSGTTMSNVAFKQCVLTGAQFTASTMKNVDLRTSDLVGLKGTLALRGSIVDTAQLIGLAAMMAAEAGIVVAD